MGQHTHLEVLALGALQGDGGVVKRILKEGTGIEAPDKGDEVFGEPYAVLIMSSSIADCNAFFFLMAHRRSSMICPWIS